MKFEFPDTGEGVTEGKFLEWLVEEGDSVEEDQAVAEVETDKAVIDVPAPSDGIIKELMTSPGDTVKVGEVILEIDTGDNLGEVETEEPVEENVGDSEDESEEPKTEDSKENVEDKKESTERKESSSDSENVLALPKIRKLAEEKNVYLASIKTGERISKEEVLEASDSGTAEIEEKTEQIEKTTETDSSETEIENPFEDDTSEKVSNSSDEILATPATRQFAREKGVDLNKVEGTGRGGKITRTDVKAAADGVNVADKDKKEDQKVKSPPKKDPKGAAERVEMSGIRKTVAKKMAESKNTIPHVTHMDKADITELHDLRERKKEDVDVHLTYMPFIMKAASEALRTHPNLNAELDKENDEVIRYSNHDFNMAVDTANGLMVPLIENIGDKNILELASEIIEKAESARERTLSPDEMRNGTFSVTNVGAIGGETFTPIISHPQVAILGLGRIQQTAEVIDGEVVPRWTVKLSLSYDHRVVDGADAARFMNTLVENLEDPESMILRL